MREIRQTSLLVPNATEHYFVFENLADWRQQTASAELRQKDHSWHGTDSLETIRQCLDQGDSRVADEYRQWQPIVDTITPPIRQRYANVASICGGSPIVPAVLAGHPLTMRTRQPQWSELAPLTIVADLTSSAAFTAKQIRQRALATLALLDYLSTIRPVTMYAFTGLGGTIWNRTNTKYAIGYLVPIPMPLDIYRTGYWLSSPECVRWIGYGWLDEQTQQNDWPKQGHWPYASHAKLMEIAKPLFQQLLGTTDDIFFIPPWYGNESKNIKQWFETMLTKFNPATAQPD